MCNLSAEPSLGGGGGPDPNHFINQTLTTNPILSQEILYNTEQQTHLSCWNAGSPFPFSWTDSVQDSSNLDAS